MAGEAHSACSNHQPPSENITIFPRHKFLVPPRVAQRQEGVHGGGGLPGGALHQQQHQQVLWRGGPLFS